MYKQFEFEGAGPGDSEEHFSPGQFPCEDCEKKDEKIYELEEQIQSCRYHLSIIMMHLYERGSGDIVELEQSVQSMCYKLNMEFDKDKKLQIEKKRNIPSLFEDDWREQSLTIKGSA